VQLKEAEAARKHKREENEKKCAHEEQMMMMQIQLAKVQQGMQFDSSDTGISQGNSGMIGTMPILDTTNDLWYDNRY
jgi:hypothetical protein